MLWSSGRRTVNYKLKKFENNQLDTLKPKILNFIIMDLNP